MGFCMEAESRRGLYVNPNVDSTGMKISGMGGQGIVYGLVIRLLKGELTRFLRLIRK